MSEPKIQGKEVWRQDCIVTAVRTTHGNYIIDEAGIVYEVHRVTEPGTDGAIPNPNAADTEPEGGAPPPESKQ